MPLHSGATALVPPMTMDFPSTSTWYPDSGSASPETSGTPRPPPEGGFTLALACQEGNGNCPLNPPPVAPPCVPSFQTVSLEIVPLALCKVVPPQARMCGLEAGKSTSFPPPLTPSLEPLSPDAAQMLTPSRAASCAAASKAVIACMVQPDSGPPQLMEITEGLFVAS